MKNQPKGTNSTPTGDNPHAACPSRPGWGVSPYKGRSPPGQPTGEPNFDHFLTSYSDHGSDWFWRSKWIQMKRQMPPK